MCVRVRVRARACVRACVRCPLMSLVLRIWPAGIDFVFMLSFPPVAGGAIVLFSSPA